MFNPSGYPTFEILWGTWAFLVPFTVSTHPFTKITAIPSSCISWDYPFYSGYSGTQTSENTIQILLLLCLQSHFTRRKPKSYSRLMCVLNNSSTVSLTRGQSRNQGVSRTMMVAQTFLAVAAPLWSPPPFSCGYLPLHVCVSLHGVLLECLCPDFPSFL